MESIAIITARGGSKRIPRKNIKEFCGQPIIAYTIKAALASRLFAKVMVSTDDMEIADIAKKYGAEVPFYRSKKNSDDYASTEDVLTEVLEKYKENGADFCWMCCLYPTAPFITADTLIACAKMFKEMNADSLVPVTKFSYPPQRCFTINDGKLKYKWPENKDMRSQDLERLYHDCGQFYFIKTEKFLKTHEIFMEKTVPYLLDNFAVQDIDNMEDWKLAEMKYKYILEMKAKNDCF